MSDQNTPRPTLPDSESAALFSTLVFDAIAKFSTMARDITLGQGIGTCRVSLICTCTSRTRFLSSYCECYFPDGLSSQELVTAACEVLQCTVQEFREKSFDLWGDFEVEEGRDPNPSLSQVPGILRRHARHVLNTRDPNDVGQAVQRLLVNRVKRIREAQAQRELQRRQAEEAEEAARIAAEEAEAAAAAATEKEKAAVEAAVQEAVAAEDEERRAIAAATTAAATAAVAAASPFRTKVLSYNGLRS